MQKLLILLFSILIFSCNNLNTKSEEIVVTAEEIKETVAFLASDKQLGRDTGSIGIEASATFIEEAFKSYGVKPFFENYKDRFIAKDIEAFNVVGIVEGTDPNLKDQIIIVGAHYDHIGTQTRIVGNDSIGNGANDNASGTSAVMAIAKYFAKKKVNKRSLMFVLFSAEEKGLLGSIHLANKLKNYNEDFYAVVNFEMIGVPFKDRDYVALLSGFNKSNMAIKLNEYLNKNFVGKSEVAEKHNLFRKSDNYPFYKSIKIPSHTVSSCDMSNYDYYHHVDDEIDKLDYNHMASLINQIIPAIEKMSITPNKEIVLTDG